MPGGQNLRLYDKCAAAGGYDRPSREPCPPVNLHINHSHLNLKTNTDTNMNVNKENTKIKLVLPGYPALLSIYTFIILIRTLRQIQEGIEIQI